MRLPHSSTATTARTTGRPWRVSGSRWELKREGDVASYLRVGGEGGIYLISQYGPPSAPEVRELIDDFPAFIEAYNDEVDELETGLSTVSFRTADSD